MWKFSYTQSDIGFEILEPIEGATFVIVSTEEEAIAKVAELNNDLADYLAHMATLPGWSDYFIKDEKRTKGYIRHFDRKSCDNCRFFSSNQNSAPKQERKYLCTKITPNFEVYVEDVCDEHQNY